jgi:indole-3-glycerol phosphate synthase
MTDKLQEIYERRQLRVAEAKKSVSLERLEGYAKSMTTRSLVEALDRPGEVSVIAEFKRRSPSAGPLRPDVSLVQVAKDYSRGGARALSILTEPDWFGGKLDDLNQAREACDLPILRKDFIFDPYQIVEAKVSGADAVLLIADMVPPSLLNELAAAAKQHGLDALVEIFTEQALPAALATGSKLIGVNARNLRTLTMHADNIVRLRDQIPPERVLVAESGIKTSADIEALKKINVGAALVGESLLKQPDLTIALRKLISGK